VSRQASVGDTAAMRRTVSRGLSLMLMLNLPATLGLIVLATPIVRLLFEHGHFLPSDTAATAGALRLYALGLIGYSAVRIASPTFYAIGESRTPAIVSVAAIAVNVIASVALVRTIGFRGLALGTSIAAVVNAGLLLWLLRRRLGGLDGVRLRTTVVKVSLSSVVMATAAVAIQHAMDRVVPGTRAVVEALKLGTTLVGSLVVLALMARLLGVEAFAESVEMVRSRVRKLLPW
jgi:putative peptidoglycan lipid II flippase